MKVIDRKTFIEEFKKLKQLDRIELRQREERISNSFIFDRSSVVSILSLLALSSLITFALAFLGAPYYGDGWFYAFENLYKTLGIYFFILLFAAVIYKIVWMRKVDKERQKLFEEYIPKLFKEKSK